MSVFANCFGSYLDFCWDIKKGWLEEEFHHWGDVYSIKFDILVTKLSNVTWINVFNFVRTNESLDMNTIVNGDRIPLLNINRNGYFHIASSVNGIANYYKDIDFELGKTYKMTIQQLKHRGKYWYEIIVDGDSKLKIENKKPLTFSTAYLYGSNPWIKSFSSEFGSICNVKIEYGGK